MKLFFTQYKIGDATYGQSIIADDELQAQSFIEARGIKEVVVGYPALNPPLFFERISARDYIFEVQFTAWLEARNGNPDVLSPEGWFGQWNAIQFLMDEPVVEKANVLLNTINDVRRKYGLMLFGKIVK